MGHRDNKNKPSLKIPKNELMGSGNASPVTPATPKTPADEAIEFFQSDYNVDKPIQVYELRLDADGGPRKEISYIRLPPAYQPYILRVSLAAGTPASKNGVFKTNFPLDGGPFVRDRYTERKLPTDFSKPIHVNLPISHAGAFVYWVEYDGAGHSGRVKGREGYFNIDPILRTKPRTSVLSHSDGKSLLNSTDGFKMIDGSLANLPLDGLSILTVVSKWMGDISNWKEYFAEASERGYNMLHYTPLQERGESNSPYSLRNQHAYDPSLFGSEQPSDGGSKKVEEVLRIARDEYGLLSLTDIVLNHTSNDTVWLKDHPEAGFSPANSPHLSPALEIDSAIIAFSQDLASKGLPTTVCSQQDIDTLMGALAEHLKTLNLWQYYVLNVDREREQVQSVLSSGQVRPWNGPSVAGKNVVELATALRLGNSIKGLGTFASRFCVSVDPNAAASLVQSAFTELQGDVAQLTEAWIRVVDVLNVPLYQEWEEDTRVALDNIKNRVKYMRLDDHGPKLGEISKAAPLAEPYFTRIYPQCEKDPARYSLANNGWIWDADPLQNFALRPSKAYLRREVIVWGDCVKLRYGDSPQDNPWLWEHMGNYVTSLATSFNGFRIDNCHSTPLEVGVEMLDKARAANPDLYVCAELFTGSEEMDLVFVKRLGINSLIRECGNGWDPKEMGRLLHRFGLGKPIGSMDAACLTSPETIESPTGKGPVRSCVIIPHNGSQPHALLFDVTHDNESMLDKRSAEDSLSTGALAAFSYCAVGSIKGFDDLYPKLLNLVQEHRQYELTGLAEKSGIARVKRIINALHLEMVQDNYMEGHVHQENDYIVLHRVNPVTGKGYLLVAHTAFSKGSKDRGHVDPVKLRQTKAKFLLGASIDIPSYETPQDEKLIKGLPCTLVEYPEVVVPQGLDHEGPYSEIVVPENFPPGSVMIFETHLEPHDSSLDAFCSSGAQEVFQELDLVDLNAVLHCADGEERDATDGAFGVYDVPGLGKLTYCGLEGWMHALRHIMRHNDLGHPLCEHLRKGTWSFDYIHQRLSRRTEKQPRLAAPAKWFEERFERIKTAAPPFLRPKYFSLVIFEAYKAARRAVVEQMSEFVSSGHDFTQDLAMCAVQMYGLVKSASLDPNPAHYTPSLAAGLPHFTAGWARCWGRDVFISLRGLFLTTKNFEAAKAHIVAFASTLKHGLIPNLLDSVRNPRYNSRDSPWWMLQNIQDYVMSAPDGLSLLSEPVKRRFPKDDTWVPWDDERAYAYSSTMAEIIQEILQRHAEGISFREHNAGPNLDMQMKPGGFDISIRVDWKTGLIFGGNEHNCGTWMDKMGESVKAGTKGKPGSPRDGAPIEITGLLKSTLKWLDELSSRKKFPFQGVDATVDGQKKFVTYKEWSDLIQASFEKSYYVPENAYEDKHYNINTSLVNRRGIYKDIFGSGPGREWSDYQLRCNFPIAMVVAPELFDGAHAIRALEIADKSLRGPLGMKTLDPQDMQYRPNYDNSNDSDDASVAKGLNYHNGPEWGWPLGYFLRAYLHFDTQYGRGKRDSKETLHYLHRVLLPLRHHIQNDPWAGIPELTNENGGYCPDSCNTQAWSASTLLDFLEEVHQFQS